MVLLNEAATDTIYLKQNCYSVCSVCACVYRCHMIWKNKWQNDLEKMKGNFGLIYNAFLKQQKHFICLKGSILYTFGFIISLSLTF